MKIENLTYQAETILPIHFEETVQKLSEIISLQLGPNDPILKDLMDLTSDNIKLDQSTAYNGILQELCKGWTKNNFLTCLDRLGYLGDRSA